MCGTEPHKDFFSYDQKKTIVTMDFLHVQAKDWRCGPMPLCLQKKRLYSHTTPLSSTKTIINAGMWQVVCLGSKAH
jgi:hypothetical protein